MGKLFDMGRVVMTATVADHFGLDDEHLHFVGVCLRRHEVADWGNLDRGDSHANNVALKSGDRLFSAYTIPAKLAFGAPDRKIWIITESGRSSTTILFPGDY